MSVNTITNRNNGIFSSKHSSSYPVKDAITNYCILKINNHNIIFIKIMETSF